mgnify:CR=1 FL=1
MLAPVKPADSLKTEGGKPRGVAREVRKAVKAVCENLPRAGHDAPPPDDSAVFLTLDRGG